MPGDLERDLRRLLGGASPQPDAATTARARAAALRAAPPPHRPARRRGRRLATAVMAVALVGLGSAAAIVVTRSGVLHDRPAGYRSHRTQPRATPAPPALRLPAATRAIAVSAAGHTWILTHAGLDASGLPSRAVAVSPRANYVAVGLGNDLVALSAARSAHVWSHREAGPVETATWAPDGLRIAYVAGGRDGPVAHIVWGTGAHDVVVGAARTVPISWRSDGLAIAYAGPGGHAVIDDFGHARSTAVVPPAGCRSMPVRALAFAPRFDRLGGIAGNGAVFVVDQDHPGKNVCLAAAGASAIAWSGRWLVVAGRDSIWLVDPRLAGDRRMWIRLGRPVVAIAAGPAAGEFVFATVRAGSLDVWTASTSSPVAHPAGRVPDGAGAVSLAWR